MESDCGTDRAKWTDLVKMNGKKTVFLEPPTQLFLAKLIVSYLKSWFVMIFFPSFDKMGQVEDLN